MINRTKVKKTWNYILQTAIVIVAYGFLYYQVFYKKDIPDVEMLLSNYSDAWIYSAFFIVFIMMFLNWSIEAIKWKFLIKKEEEISFFTSLKAVFAGVTVSIFTPNRVGEYFGRVFILKKTHPWKGIFITIIGSFSQLLVTMLIGTISFWIFSKKYLTNLTTTSEYLLNAMIITSIALVIFMFLFYFNVKIVEPIANRLLNSRWKKTAKYIKIFSAFKTSELLKVFLLSLSRYVVFTLQYIILLRAFQVPVSIIDAVMLITLLLFIMTAIPTISLAEIGIRGSVIISIFSIFFNNSSVFISEHELTLVTTTLFIWIINLVLPAIIGSIFVFQLKFFKKNNSTK